MRTSQYGINGVTWLVYPVRRNTRKQSQKPWRWRASRLPIGRHTVLRTADGKLANFMSKSAVIDYLVTMSKSAEAALRGDSTDSQEGK